MDDKCLRNQINSNLIKIERLDLTPVTSGPEGGSPDKNLILSPRRAIINSRLDADLSFIEKIKNDQTIKGGAKKTESRTVTSSGTRFAFILILYYYYYQFYFVFINTDLLSRTRAKAMFKPKVVLPVSSSGFSNLGMFIISII